MLFRCWLASWAAFVIILPNQSLHTLGNASYFALLTALFLPPSLPVQLFLFILSTLMVGILLGWGIGSAAMKAAFTARNSALLNSQLQQAQLAASKSPNPQAVLSSYTYHGTFLDIRSSAIYGCFLAFGVFIFGLMRAYSPKLIFMSIFGTIAVDIFCVIGPLLPSLQYTILNSVLISASCYAAIAVVVTILVFPETMNRSCLFATSQLLEKISGLIMLQDDVLDSKPEELVKGNALLDVLGSKRENIVDALQQLMATSGFINLEFSRGKWNGDDVRALEEPLLAVVSRAAFLSGFAKLVGRCSNATCGATAVPTSTEEEDEPISETSSATALSPGFETTPDSYLIRQMYARNEDAEKAQNLRTRDMFPILKECTADLRSVCGHGILCAKAAVVIINDHRWRSNTEEDDKVQTELQNSIALLSRTLEEFKDTKRMAIVGPYEELIKNARTPEEQDSLPLRPLYLAFVFAGNLVVLANVTLTLLELIRNTTNKRKENRLWVPKGLRALGKLLTARGDKQDGAFGDDGAPSYEKSEDDGQSYRRDPDSRPPTNVTQKVMDGIHKLWIWAKTAEASFTFKYVIISVALWIPSVCRRSAHFYYVEKGVWALIMAQTTLNIYAGDQIFNLVARLIGTLIGLVTGLLAWYIGNGSSNGNPYGTAATVGVLLVPTVFVRMFAPQHLTGVILYCATFALVVGYSWIDGHLPQYSTPGIGWSVAWKRWTLVVIGVAASFIIMMLPPVSGRKAVRMGNSSTVVGITNVYNFVTSAWISTQFRGKADPHAAWIVSFRAKIIALTHKVQSVQKLTELAKWEGNIRGHWPYDEYVRLGEVQLEMTAALAQLGGALSHLEDNWRLTFLHNTKALNPNFIADVMSIFSLISQSLRTGEPIPQVLPYPFLQRLLYHHHHSHIAPSEAHKEDPLDIDKVKTLDYMFYATGLVAVFQLLQSLDELHQITKRLCGEVPLKGFDRWRHEYGRLHEEVVSAHVDPLTALRCCYLLGVITQHRNSREKAPPFTTVCYGGRVPFDVRNTGSVEGEDQAIFSTVVRESIAVTGIVNSFDGFEYETRHGLALQLNFVVKVDGEVKMNAEEQLGVDDDLRKPRKCGKMCKIQLFKLRLQI